MENTLTTKGKWEAVWAHRELPIIASPAVDVQRQLDRFLPHPGAHSLVEIGCAPGGWMAYFDKKYGYRVAGLEYADAAAELTKQNMRMQKINASVFVQDFFDFDFENNRYDIVFSAGFVEHFRDVPFVVEKICKASNKYVVTMVPNLFGINGVISKTIRPEVYAEHTPIDVDMLESNHGKCGLKTLFCGFVGGPRFIMPGANNAFFEKHKLCARLVNIPFYCFNQVSEQSQRRDFPTLRTRLLSDCILYVGMKQE